ncbi:MAG: chemotaxis protein CheA, partial [Gammaproteobacteria bacterium]|nr:chemotaxis protein CheA [Gammaproteobacteria bacterium]MCW9005295.1 chemotaxis protein CheA [Gammaproteobacteria bacterium]
NESAQPVAEEAKSEATQPVKAAATTKAPAGDNKKAANAGSSSIRVSIDKIDDLINMVGELVITQSMLSLLGEDFTMENLEKLQDGLGQLERHTREMQESVMMIRMLPISFSFSRFPRLVRDLSTQMGKKIDLVMSGENTEIDKTLIEKIGDPLVHLVRNSLDHGIEMPADRIAAGKNETGTINLNAYHKGGNIVIEITDDGKGIDPDAVLNKAIEKGLVPPGANLSNQQINELIFQAGFSTAKEITDVSGRGVGMDVVRKNIASLGGAVEIQSEFGKGSTFTIRLPLTLAILDGQTVIVGDEIYIIPLVSIVESIQINSDMINKVAGKGETFKLRDEYIPIVRLSSVFGIENAKAKELEDGLLVVVEADRKPCGLFIDDLLGQQQVVIKSLEQNYHRVDGVSGATILGDGSVALILDIPGLLRMSVKH